MRGIAATKWEDNWIDIFYLHGPSMHYASGSVTDEIYQWTQGPYGDLGGIFTSVPAAVSCLAHPPMDLHPEIATTDATSGPADPVELAPSGPVAVSSAGETSAASSHIIHPPVPMAHRTDVFGLGLDYAMYHQILWRGIPAHTPQWARLGGIFISAPAVVAWQGERLDVFGLGLDRAMFHKTWNGKAWTQDWDRLGGIFTSEASVVSWGSDRLDVFARGSDFTLRHRAYNGTTWLTDDWQNLGGSLASAPTAVTWGPNRLDVFAIGKDGTLIHKWWDGDIWNEWETLGPADAKAGYVSTPTAASWGPERLDVFVIGNDGNLYWYLCDSGAWSKPQSLGNDISSAPAAISPAAGQIHLIIPDKEGKIVHTAWQGSAWNPNRLTIAGLASGGGVSLPTLYRFAVENVRVSTPRSLYKDTDTAQCSVTPGNWPTQTVTQALPDLGVPTPEEAQTNLLYFQPVAVELCEEVIFNYQVVNKGNPDPNVVDAALNKAGKSLAQQAIKSIAKELGQGITVITSIQIGSLSSVPVIGSILGLVEQWLISQLEGIIFANCDGIVAVEQLVISGRDLHLRTAHGPYRVTTTHPGTNSATGCGENSKYEVTWSISRF